MNSSQFDPAKPLIVYVTEAFESVFEGVKITSDSDFFELGGGSIEATELSMVLETLLGIEVHPSLLLLNADVKSIAVQLEEDIRSAQIAS